MCQRRTDNVPTHPQDWHFLGCQVTHGSDVLIHAVGTFGISSASCCWSRVAGATGRLAHHLVSSITSTWHMLVADDCVLECGGPRYRMGLVICFVLCATCRASSVLGQTAGGDNLVWVGFEILLRSHSLGLTQRRTEWFVEWTSQVASSPTFHVASFEEGLGSAVFGTLM